MGEDGGGNGVKILTDRDVGGKEVEIRTLDSYGLTDIGFIKIDVEGAEIEVWRGMQETVERNPNLQIMMEVNCARYPDRAAEFIASIEAKYPLQQIEFSGAHRPTSAEEVIGAPDDVMLFLRRTPPAGPAR